ncbi:MAG: TetR/AcrR family transcriptional regulator [Pseudomonadota bacterium]
MTRAYKKSASMRELLLDTAEALFAERGFHGASVRDITETANVRNASINYHFESKENLFLAVIERRIEPLAALRRERLLETKPDPAEPETSVRHIVRSFAEPMLDFAAHGGPGWKNYCVLIAHLAVQKQWGENTVTRKYDDHAHLFLEALQSTFPDADSYRVHCCFQFLLSTTLYAVCNNERLDTLSSGQFRSDDLARLRAPFLDYAVGGIVNVAGKK